MGGISSSIHFQVVNGFELDDACHRHLTPQQSNCAQLSGIRKCGRSCLLCVYVCAQTCERPQFVLSREPPSTELGVWRA